MSNLNVNYMGTLPKYDATRIWWVVPSGWQ